MSICKIINYQLYLKVKAQICKVRSFWLSKQFLSMGKKCKFEGIGYLKGLNYISIGDNVHFDQMLYLTAWGKFGEQQFYPQIIIQSDSSFGAFNHITSINKIVIGKACLTGKFVTISDNNHGSTSLSDLKKSPLCRELVSNGEIIIGDNVWIGDKATILGNVKIGDGAVIAANAVVTKDVPPYSVAAGNPAKVIKINKIK